MFFTFVFVVVILQRMIELAIARSNSRYLRAQGGVEVGQGHYKYIVIMHVLFLCSLLVEVINSNRTLSRYWWLPFSLFVLAQVGRYWCIHSLGRHWNTRIIILPDSERLVRGPYRYVQHPNYWIVGIELLVLPLTFSAYLTAILFSLLNLWILLRIRIPQEEQALAMLTQQQSSSPLIHQQDNSSQLIPVEKEYDETKR